MSKIAIVLWEAQTEESLIPPSAVKLTFASALFEVERKLLGVRLKEPDRDKTTKGIIP